ncbi:MAG: hypothetical protein NXI14_08780 [bacterium]|nr:hypothetical protein [bacterium]
MQNWFWRQHSPAEAAWTAILIALNIILLSLAIGFAFDVAIPASESQFKWASPDFVAIAGYAGAVFGFLQAVLVFVAQIRSQQDSSMLPLTIMFARKYHAFEILALSAGIAIANLTAALLAPFLAANQEPTSWPSNLYAPMLAMNLVLLPAMTALSLWMLASIIADAGNSDVQAVKPVVRAAMATAAQEDAQLVGSANLFVSELRESSLAYSPFAHSAVGRADGSSAAFDIGRTGTLVDVDCVALHQLGRICRRLDGVSIEFAALPGQDWSASHGAVARFGSSNYSEDEIEKHRARLQPILRKALIVNSRSLG